MKNVIGVIFADSHYANLKELTAVRPLAALPVNGRYRIIDFVLSNMVNSGMRNVAVVTQNNYHSLKNIAYPHPYLPNKHLHYTICHLFLLYSKHDHH